jgi:uncharacterized protein
MRIALPLLYLKNPEAPEELKREIAASEKRNKNIGIISIIVFLSLFVGVGGFFFVKSYRNLIEVFRGMLMGKLGFSHGLFMVPIIAFSSSFGLVFIVIPMVSGSAVYGVYFKKYEYVLDSPKELLWLLVPFFGTALLIALMKIRFKGNEGLKIS